MPEEQTEQHNERKGVHIFRPLPDGEEVARKSVTAYTSRGPEVGCWSATALVLLGTLALGFGEGDPTFPELISGMIGLLLIGILLNYLIKDKSGGLAVAAAYYPGLSIFNKFSLSWTRLWTRERALYLLSADSTVLPGLVGYNLRLNDQGIAIMNQRQAASSLEYCAIYPWIPEFQPVYTPRQMLHFREKLEAHGIELETRSEDLSELSYGNVRTVKYEDGALAIYTHDDRIVKIPRAFPQEEIMEVLREKVPDAVERGEKLS